jgi:hypothetical protein
MIPKQDHLGRCELRKGVPRASQDWLECQILITLGGLAAEARHTGVYAWEMAVRDRQYVRQLAMERAGTSRAERLEQRLLAKVEHLLARAGHWRAVELIAAELLRRGVVSGRAARRLFEQAIG